MSYPTWRVDLGPGNQRGLQEGPAGVVGGTAYLFGLHRGRAAVPAVVVAERSVVDGITVIVSHEGLDGGQRQEGKVPC